MLDTFLTPTPLHYVRDHLTTVPQVDARAWRLEIGGLVQRPCAFSLAQLNAFPRVELPVTMECAGNGGANGVIGGVGCVSTALWSGPRLRDVLETAGVLPDACEVVARGADSGSDPDEPLAGGGYARGLPLAKALDPNTLVALQMNGESLPPQHGFPARLVVPGWFGMDAIKWLARLTVVREPFDGYYSAHRYREHRGADGRDSGRPIRELRVKALFAWPEAGEIVPLDTLHLVRGAAWAGQTGVARVDVSTDGGHTWQPANLDPQRGRYAWRQWFLPWRPRQPGPYELLARATDTDGNSQPLERVPDQVYEANWVQRVPVQARITTELHG